MLATGGGAFVLKRYEDAVKANDNIHAVIEGVGLSNDGGGKYILAPSVGGQMQVLRGTLACLVASAAGYANYLPSSWTRSGKQPSDWLHVLFL